MWNTCVRRYQGFTPDGVHPNADGYAAMARVWHAVVSAALASRDQP